MKFVQGVLGHGCGHAPVLVVSPDLAAIHEGRDAGMFDLVN